MVNIWHLYYLALQDDQSRYLHPRLCLHYRRLKITYPDYLRGFYAAKSCQLLWYVALPENKSSKTRQVMNVPEDPGETWLRSSCDL